MPSVLEYSGTASILKVCETDFKRMKIIEANISEGASNTEDVIEKAYASRDAL